MTWNNLPIRIWRTVIVISTVILAIYIPLKLVLNLEYKIQYEIVSWLITIIYTADIFVNYFNQKKEAQIRIELNTVKPNNGFSIRLLIDIISAIPFGIITGTGVLELLRLIKFVRVADYMHELRQRLLKVSDYLSLAFFVFWLIFLTHWLTCGWLAIHNQQAGLDNVTKYMKSLFWCVETLTTVGYGETIPSTNYQILYSIVVMLFGVAVYGFVIGNVASILSKRDPAKVHYMHNIEGLKSFVKFRKLPFSLQKRIRDYYAYIWKQRLGFDESVFLSTLPSNLRNEVSLQLKRELLEKIPLFKGVSDKFLNEVSLHLRPEVFTPGDFIFRKGDSGNEMFLIIKGSLEVLSEDGKSAVNTLSDGDFFGEIALFTNNPRTASIRTVTYSDLYILDKQVFNHIIKDYPEIASKIRKIAEERHMNT